MINMIFVFSWSDSVEGGGWSAVKSGERNGENGVRMVEKGG